MEFTTEVHALNQNRTQDPSVQRLTLTTELLARANFILNTVGAAEESAQHRKSDCAAEEFGVLGGLRNLQGGC